MHARNIGIPEHGEVGLGHLAARRQIEPDLEQLGRVVLPGVDQWKHLAMDDALASGEPLHIAAPKAGGGTE